VALLFVDLDYFKHINDSLGHAVGDQVLQSAARRLSACVRATDTVCRQGGDEFVILLAEIEQPQDAALVAEKLLVALRRAAAHWPDTNPCDLEHRHQRLPR
jgi:diguanylate cyclase (GGDEF)-like protein